MDWRNREPVFTQSEVTEMQKSFANEFESMHTRLYNTLHKYTNKEDITLDLVSMLEDIYDNMRILEKDIKIEVTDGKSN